MHLPKLNELATLVVRTKMFPYFDVSNYILMCCMVRDDYAISGWFFQIIQCLQSISCIMYHDMICLSFILEELFF